MACNNASASCLLGFREVNPFRSYLTVSGRGSETCSFDSVIPTRCSVEYEVLCRNWHVNNIFAAGAIVLDAFHYGPGALTKGPAILRTVRTLHRISSVRLDNGIHSALGSRTCQYVASGRNLSR